MSKLQQLLNPPIQPVLLAASVAMLAMAGWKIIDLKMRGAASPTQAGMVNVAVPDIEALQVPDVNQYVQMVEAPLFWESRQVVKPAEAATEVVAEVPPVDTTLPEGRLVGVVNNAGEYFAIVSNAAGESVRLRKGGTWGAWQVAELEADRVVLALGGQRHELPLVADFAAPQESPQVAQARAAAQQRAAEQQAEQAQPAMQQAAAAQPAQAGLPFPNDAGQQPPALAADEALVARQRLMAARWGALSGEAQGAATQGRAGGQQ